MGVTRSKLRSKERRPEPEAIPGPSFPIVGVGASAGGLEAVTQLLRSVPGGAKMAFVLVHHLDPEQPSGLASILSRATRMKVVEAKHGVRVERDHVYVIPPNKTLGISKGTLRLSPRRTAAEPHAPVNYFFRALAEDQGGRAIGIVLSGTGDDGAQGLEAIKAADGVTFAQTEESAKHSGMPASAGGSADFILSPEEIGAELVRIGKHPRAMHSHAAHAAELPPQDADEFKDICTLLRTHAGIDFSQYKPNTLNRRITRRMVLQKADTVPHYVARLRQNPGELDALMQDILISVTGFFRDPKVFDILKRKIFPRILKHKEGDEAIRVWVPGCSTGEEVFSLAIVLVEFMEAHEKKCPLQLFGTDVNETILNRARSAKYPEAIKADVSPERLRRFFTKADGGHRINKAIRDLCIFARQNLAVDAPFSKVDLVSCRNVLIYFGAPMQKRVIPILHYALNPHGFLLLGSAESVGSFADLFELAEPKHRIYAKRTAATRTIAGLPPFITGAGSGEIPRQAAMQRNGEAVLGEVRRQADAIVLCEFAPDGVVVNSRMDILQFRGRTGSFLEHGPGAANLNLLQMARQGLAMELRPLIAKAAKLKRTVRREGVQVRDNGHLLSLDVRVIPFQAPPSDERFFLVLFEEKSAASVPASGKGKTANRSVAQREVAQWREELSATKQSLHILMEEHDAANEELRAANEEALSINEELQSTNEELETSKEEMQSTNEELTTLNEELQNRNLELQEVSDDLLNLFNSVDFSIVMLDRDLRIRRFTPKAQTVLKLIPGDVGRPITDLKFSLDLPDLQASIVRVLDSLNVEERETQDRGGRWFHLRIRPYRTSDDRIDGVVLTLVDIDPMKRSLLEAERAQRFAEAIVATAREPLLVLDGTLHVKMANRSFYEFFKVNPADTEDRFIYELGKGQWDIPELRELLEKILPAHTVLADFRFEAKFPIVGRRTMLLNAARLATPENDTDWILLAMQDVSGGK